MSAGDGAAKRRLPKASPTDSWKLSPHADTGQDLYPFDEFSMTQAGMSIF